MKCFINNKKKASSQETFSLPATNMNSLYWSQPDGVDREDGVAGTSYHYMDFFKYKRKIY